MVMAVIVVMAMVMAVIVIMRGSNLAFGIAEHQCLDQAAQGILRQRRMRGNNPASRANTSGSIATR